MELSPNLLVAVTLLLGEILVHILKMWGYYVQILVTVRKEMSGFREAMLQPVDMWRSATRMCGVLCVITCGVLQMLKSSALNLDSQCLVRLKMFVYYVAIHYVTNRGIAMYATCKCRGRILRAAIVAQLSRLQGKEILQYNSCMNCGIRTTLNCINLIIVMMLVNQ